MASNLFDRLAELEVPPPPAQFDTQLHERMNRSITRTQLVDLATGGMPWAMLQMSRALLAFVSFTLTGRYESDPKKRRNRGA